jgi:hypothetical protein
LALKLLLRGFLDRERPDKKKAGPKARHKVEVRQRGQNLPEGTADTTSPGGRKRCRVEISHGSYRPHRASLQCSMPHERAALNAWLSSYER